MSNRKPLSFKKGTELASEADLVAAAQRSCTRIETIVNGNPDIEEIDIEEVVILYSCVTSRDKYRSSASAVFVRDISDEPKKEQPKEENLPAPKLRDPDDGDYHESDATGVPDSTDSPIARVSPHGETLEEELEFDEKDVLADNAEPSGWDLQP